MNSPITLMELKHTDSTNVTQSTLKQ